MTVDFKSVTLPIFGLPTDAPTIPSEVYAERMKKAMAACKAYGVEALVVYADREHSANMHWLIGYDPRFEEALLIITPGNKPLLLVGNEGVDYAHVQSTPVREGKVEVALFQSFSLMGQQRGQSLPLESLMAKAGLVKGMKTGVVGWKYFDETDGASAGAWSELPAYIVVLLNEVIAPGLMTNLNIAFMHPVSGLRAVNEVEQLAMYEHAACYTSQGVRNVLFGVKPGMTEYEAVQLMDYPGIPFSCHLMLHSEPEIATGLRSPRNKPIIEDNFLTMAYGLWGALNCRAGYMTHKEQPELHPEYLQEIIIPYFTAIAKWYEHIGIGVQGGELYDIVEKELAKGGMKSALNPGHLIGLDEWLNSPIYKDSTEELVSGMALQVDVIPHHPGRKNTTNIEDGIALADGALRQTFADKYPEAWLRIQMRRNFMENILGIELKPEVLPFSNIPAYLSPLLLKPDYVPYVASHESAEPVVHAEEG